MGEKNPFKILKDKGAIAKTSDFNEARSMGYRNLKQDGKVTDFLTKKKSTIPAQSQSNQSLGNNRSTLLGG